VNTLGDELPRQIARVREIVIVYEGLAGEVGKPAAFLMKRDLDAASKAMIEGDVVAMLRVCESLKEWKL
jgi:hypothetical protein